MKNTLKLIGFIALTAFIGFTLAACKHSSDPETNVFWSIDEVSAFLSTAAGGSTTATAIPLTVNVNLNNMTDAGSGWRQLLNALGAANKLVKLDLSGSGFYGTVFDPDSSVSTGKDLIVSLVLPNNAKSIPGDIYPNNAFASFINLASCSGANITSIGADAFFICDALESVSFPAVKSIGERAFYYCIALESVGFPAAESIGLGAFSYCIALENISFPAAESIGEYAFYCCDALESVSFPAAESIGLGAFGYCSALESVSFPAVKSIGEYAFSATGGTTLTITMGSAAPTVDSNIFDLVNDPKMVTVLVPTGATGYGTSPTDTTTENWGNAFRGMGWDGSSYLGVTVNSFINLSIVNPL